MRAPIAELKTIATIKAAQSSAAQAKVVQAATLLEDKSAVLSRSEEACRAAMALWTRCVTSEHLPLDLMVQAAQDVHRRDEEQRLAAKDVSAAEDALKIRRQAWNLALIRHEQTQEALRRAQERWLADLDEAALDTTSESLAWRMR
jgi:hypothetical protein